MFGGKGFSGSPSAVAAIQSGTINGATIGATTPAAGAFTTLSSTGASVLITQFLTYAGNGSPTAAQCKNAFIFVTAAGTITLPAVAAGVVGTKLVVYSTTAAAVSVDANANDRIVLSGTALDDGDKITNDSTAGSFVELYCDTTAGWRTLNIGGTWIDGGA